MNDYMCETGFAYFADDALYEHYEKQSSSAYNRRCIDGKITGCGNCVGYCQFEGHPGFLTSRLRTQQDCINKQCHYYLPKPKRNKLPDPYDISEELMAAAQDKAVSMEGLRFIKVAEEVNRWVLSYITISNEYTLDSIAEKLQDEFGISVSFRRLNYDFDICVRLLMDSVT